LPRGKFYTPEFKEQAVKRVIEGPETMAQVARKLGVNDKTLGGWVSVYRRKNAGRPLPDDMPEQDQIRELERRNRELEAEVAFLKKAAAYFAKEQR
jgi:transposase